MLTRRDFLTSMGIGAGSVVLGRNAAAAKKRPNILWVIAEDMNPWLSCYGETLIETPVFDGMAAQGVMFSRAYVTCPVCSPEETT